MYVKSHGPNCASFISNRDDTRMCGQNTRLQRLIRSKEILRFEGKYIIVVFFYKVQVWLVFGL